METGWAPIYRLQKTGFTDVKSVDRTGLRSRGSLAPAFAHVAVAVKVDDHDHDVPG
jgi:hypothetical protein